MIEFRAAIEIDDQPFGSLAPIRLRLLAVIIIISSFSVVNFLIKTPGSENS